jgi:hypothetical protein
MVSVAAYARGHGLQASFAAAWTCHPAQHTLRAECACSSRPRRAGATRRRARPPTSAARPAASQAAGQAAGQAARQTAQVRAARRPGCMRAQGRRFNIKVGRAWGSFSLNLVSGPGSTAGCGEVLGRMLRATGRSRAGPGCFAADGHDSCAVCMRYMRCHLTDCSPGAPSRAADARRRRRCGRSSEARLPVRAPLGGGRRPGGAGRRRPGRAHAAELAGALERQRRRGGPARGAPGARRA